MSGYVLDPDARRLGPRLLLGGRPARAVRLSAAGARALDAVLAGRHEAGTEVLARRLVRAGALHPRPRPRTVMPGELTIVIPVRDRAVLIGPLVEAVRAYGAVVVVDDASVDGTAEAARRAGARVLRREVAGGPAAARNEGLRAARTDLVAFLDSDCEPRPGWLDRLAGHLADPAVAVVAPRIVGCAPAGSVVARYEQARSALDMGPRADEVRPGTRVPYVPAAALLARRDALLGAGGFDEALRYGEDVDLVWRLAARGAAVRYEPEAQVTHRHPRTVPELLARRHGYGRAAAPLAVRHPEALVACELSPWGAGAIAAAVAGRPLVAAGVLAGSAAAAAWRLGAVTTVPGESRALATLRTAPQAARLAGAGHLAAALQTAEAATRTWLPITAAAVVVAPRGVRRRVAGAVVAGVLLEHARRRPAVGRSAYLALRLAEDAAYCSGVWRGCLQERSRAPLALRVRRSG